MNERIILVGEVSNRVSLARAIEKALEYSRQDDPIIVATEEEAKDMIVHPAMLAMGHDILDPMTLQAMQTQAELANRIRREEAERNARHGEAMLHEAEMKRWRKACKRAGKIVDPGNWPDGCCSCHLTPPCFYCTSLTEAHHEYLESRR